ncbi:amidohydrolase family protein [Agromyces sp. NPDC058484]|uniref:amidohydrolase family protein n=1 Tax=Agromyces sp. NPDC058484 TaxID=3346524 RepID=UPI003664AA60
MTSRVIAADWVLPISGAAVADGAVVVDGDRIAWLGHLGEMPVEWRSSPLDRFPGVITPGLVNAHTHLQYSHFDEVGRGRYTSFEHWSDVFGDRYEAVTDPEHWRSAALDGARQAVASGTTVFAEIVTNDEARGALGRHGAGGIEYLEAIGQFNSRWQSGGRAEFLDWLDEPSGVPHGVSPHAPYSLDGAVITELVAIAGERGLRLHSHLGESAVEAELYLNGGKSVLGAYGDLRDEFELVRRGGAGHTTAGYADSIGLLGEHTHVAHAIYLERADRDLLLQRGTRVALCPRSNAVIGLDPAPVAAYLFEGHDIAVGTDSLASTPSLDLMADVRELAVLAQAQGYTADDLHARLMRAATFGGAAAMGLDGDGYGTLTQGGPADLAVFDVQVGGDGAVERAMVERAAGCCSLTMRGGRVIHERAALR